MWLQGILEAGFEAAPLTPDMQDTATTEQSCTEPTVMFNIPGSSAGTEIPYEEWKNAYHLHHQQGRVASGSAESSGMVEEPPAAERSVLEAWGSSENMETSQQEERLEEQKPTAQNEDRQSKRDALKKEW